MNTIQFIRDTPEGRLYSSKEDGLYDLVSMLMLFGGLMLTDYEEAMKGNYYVILK